MHGTEKADEKSEKSSILQSYAWSLMQWQWAYCRGSSASCLTLLWTSVLHTTGNYHWWNSLTMSRDERRGLTWSWNSVLSKHKLLGRSDVWCRRIMSIVYKHCFVIADLYFRKICFTNNEYKTISMIVSLSPKYEKQSLNTYVATFWWNTLEI